MVGKNNKEMKMDYGYYWVYYGHKWRVAEYDGQWWFAGIEEPVDFECLCDIGEKIEHD